MTARRRPKVLLVGWDAADWKVIHPLMDAGRMPNLARLVERGAMSNLSTLKPVLSPMLWTSIATGKRPFDHGILGFTEPTPDGAAVQPVSALSRKTKAIWNILNQEGLTSQVVGWWPSQPVEPIRGAMVSNQFHRAVGPPDQPWPIVPGSVHPPKLAEALAPLRVNPLELGAEEILPFVPLAGEIDLEQDGRLVGAVKTLAECVTVHNVATHLLAGQDSDFFAVYYDAIDHFCHGYMRYHPPRQDWVAERDFELFQHVVTTAYLFHDAMLGALLHLAGPDTTVILCSDHGFHPDHLRPRQIPHEPAGPAVEHRDHGVFLIAGPGIKQDHFLHGTSLLDVTPTILSVYGLPVGEDMHGKPLVEAFEVEPRVETIPSWDAVAGDDARHAAEIATDPIAAREALEQLVELGYVEEMGEDVEAAVTRTARELRYNLARSYMDADRHGDARPLLEALHSEAPSEYRYGLQLAMCLRALEEPAALRRLVESLTKQRRADAIEARRGLTALADRLRERRKVAGGADAPGGVASGVPRPEGEQAPRDAARGDEQTPLDPGLLDERERAEWTRLRGLAQVRSFDLEYLMGWVCLAEDRPEEALASLRRAERAEPDRPGLPIQIGEAYLALSRPGDALRAFEQAIAVDPLNPHAHLGIARACLARGQTLRAAEAALETIGLLYHYPMAHYVLGEALRGMGRDRDAVAAYESVVAQIPHARDAHARLLELFTGPCADADRAAVHREALAAIDAGASAEPNETATDEAAEPNETATDEAAEPNETATDEGDALAHAGAASPAPIVRSRPLDPAKTITIVSGLPRSGTSMMMQMLEAAGLEIATDRARVADEDNPRGYYELDAVKRIRQDAGFLPGLVGRTVKIVAPLLPALPDDFDYRIVFMERDLDEVLDSQRTLLDRNDRGGGRAEEGAMKRAYARQLRQVKVWMARHENVAAVFVAHAEVLADPERAARDVAAFLRAGGEGPAADGERAMAAVVDTQLHRQRRAS